MLPTNCLQVHEPRLPIELLCDGEVKEGLLVVADLLHVFVSKHASVLDLLLFCFDCIACGVHESVLHYYC